MALNLVQAKVLVCVGSGGVGKTTMAASLGVAASLMGRRVLVLTVDPSRRLADALGVDPKTHQSTVKTLGSGSLTVEMIQSKQVFNDFIFQVAPSQEVGERLLKNRLFGELAGTLSDSQDFTSLVRLLTLTSDPKFDLIILDTPPTQNAMDFLLAPERIFALFQDSVTKWFRQEKGQGFWQQVFHQGTKTVLSALEKITGSAFLRELADFFALAGQLQNEVATISKNAHKLLSNVSTHFILVTAFDEAKLKEAVEFAMDFQRLGHHLQAVIINRARPDWLKTLPTTLVLNSGNETLGKLIGLQRSLSEYYTDREAHYDKLLGQLHQAVEIIRVAEEKDGIYGLQAILKMAEKLRQEFQQGGA